MVTATGLGIKRVYIRHYRDNGSTVAYCEWSDGSRTEGHIRPQCHCVHGGQPSHFIGCDGAPFGEHMTALMNRAVRDGAPVSFEVW